jgi:hypothetical protein
MEYPRMNAYKQVAEAVEKAQRILAEYAEPGPRNCEKTINKLLDVLDDGALIEAVDEVKRDDAPLRRVAEIREVGR